MLRKVETPNYQAFLVGYRLPWLTFSADRTSMPSVQPVWSALAAESWDVARRSAQATLDEQRLFRTDERAALLAGLAAAEVMSGRMAEARLAATRSMELFPAQWTARRVLIEVDSRQRDYTACYRMVSDHADPAAPAAWDEVLPASDRQYALASYSWKLGQWERVATHLQEAFPAGLDAMPEHIREDWFRLALYRSLPGEASRAAATLIHHRPAASADELLQTIVQSGWTNEALPLYREIYRVEPGNELVRRRLVALCIKEGQLEEARRIASSAPLRFAA